MYRKPFIILGIVFGLIGAAFLIAGICVYAFIPAGQWMNEFRFGTDAAVSSFVFLLIGAIFFVMGLIFFLVVAAVKRRQESLRSQGIRIDAAVDQVANVYWGQYNYGYRMPCTITLRWENQRDGKTYIYRSEPLSFNPENYMKDHHITTLPVYIDRENPKRYYVDVSQLTQNIVAT